MEPPRFRLIVLAAGLSRRMGGPNKLLRSYRGAPLLAHALKIADEFEFTDRIAVTGSDRDAVEVLAKSFNFRCIANARFEEGLGSSIAAGARALRPAEGESGIFIALGDMPAIGTGDYRALASQFAGGVIAAPFYKGSRGHPVLFCSSYLTELCALTGDEGARPILKRHAALIRKVETENPSVLRDIDTPQDFEAGGAGSAG